MKHISKYIPGVIIQTIAIVFLAFMAIMSTDSPYSSHIEAYVISAVAFIFAIIIPTIYRVVKYKKNCKKILPSDVIIIIAISFSPLLLLALYSLLLLIG